VVGEVHDILGLPTRDKVVNLVLTGAVGEHERIVGDPVAVVVAIEMVVAGATIQHIVVALAVQPVVAVAAIEYIVAVVAD
jgi:CO/xanthine dehydrogenase Mo-binding subunit